ncbi:phage tail protein [Cyclobacterium jeungdonense]|uniref:Tail fiber protein n=1 Tax=Cyclobacterium jeungdonense TaxID=708087 RepID=A0ABT8C9E7_9BACT|nr:tail fiber protein [Cyclobacterium jeungdonense]MDN3688649.1 tail fiber protein [Cyclobacterium jeungdonense]
MEELMGTIKMFAGNFAPRGYALCNGQILAISQNQALFSILGTTYGGDGRTTFALPDLRGRVPMGPGQGPGLSNRQLGEIGGKENTTLTVANLPAHNHTLSANSASGNTNNPQNAFPALSQVQIDRSNPPVAVNAFDSAANTTMNAQAIGIAGQSQAFDQMPPFCGMNFIICTEGIYPSRN